MKKLIYSLFVLMVIWSCTPLLKTGSAEKHSTIKSDSTEYEITIIDTDFDRWYLMHFSPVQDYSNEYYKSKNRLGVSNWNANFTRSRFQRVIENYIFYDYNADYGIEVNRKLFWYFKYVEDQYRIRLLN